MMDKQSWFEKGDLPPAGADVEVKHHNSWVGATVVGWFGTIKKCAVCAPNGGGFFGFYLDEIRPIKSEREKFVEASLKKFDEISEHFPPTENASLFKLFGNMFDAGFRAPESSQLRQQGEQK